MIIDKYNVVTDPSLSVFAAVLFSLSSKSMSSKKASLCCLPGIPKFYRWLSERYPLVNQPIADTSVPEVDNLYLDMNGIIHNCTHGNDPNTKLTEQQMIVKVFNYLEKLFQIVQPKKLLFMAIDGALKLPACSSQGACFTVKIGVTASLANMKHRFLSLAWSYVCIGVAPRAKMNQQRSRRFKAAKERLEVRPPHSHTEKPFIFLPIACKSSASSPLLYYCHACLPK